VTIPDYHGWWVGKMCRTRPGNNFKKVLRVELVGRPSFGYGFVILHYIDGTSENVPHGNAFRPRKKDVEVLDIVEDKVNG